jgi:hypothetical protein
MLAKELGVAVLALSQLSGPAETCGGALDHRERRVPRWAAKPPPAEIMRGEDNLSILPYSTQCATVETPARKGTVGF